MKEGVAGDVVGVKKDFVNFVELVFAVGKVITKQNMGAIKQLEVSVTMNALCQVILSVHWNEFKMVYIYYCFDSLTSHLICYRFTLFIDISALKQRKKGRSRSLDQRIGR